MNSTKLTRLIHDIAHLEEKNYIVWYNQNKKNIKLLHQYLSPMDLEGDNKGRNPYRQLLFHIVNNITDKPQCDNKNCTNFVKWNSTSHKYQQFCSNVCNHKNGELYKKRKTTCTSLYGVDNIFKQTDYIKQKRLENLGVEHAMQSETVKIKFHNTCQQKYGVDHPWMNKKVRSKSVDSRDYSTDYVTAEQKNKLNDFNWMSERLTNNHLTQQQVAAMIGVSQSTVGIYATKHGIICDRTVSKIEKQITQYISSITNGQIVNNDRTTIAPYELDIYLPTQNLAFEINGVFWHSECNGKLKKYHLNKTQKCIEQNIQLVHIYDTEWYTKQQIVKSRISSMLNGNTKIYGRKCIIAPVPKQKERMFIEQNHIQGFAASSMCYGLYYKNELVSIMTFGKARFGKQQYELIRYCSLRFTNVLGGAGKLFNHFVKKHNPQSVVSYCDLRWGKGVMYTNIGFSYSHTSLPNYKYFIKNNVGKTHKLMHRQQFQKHKLKHKLDIFDPNLTEWQNMINNGYDRIWDCGNLVYVWNALPDDIVNI